MLVHSRPNALCIGMLYPGTEKVVLLQIAKNTLFPVFYVRDVYFDEIFFVYMQYLYHFMHTSKGSQELTFFVH